jgi:hypothetical protein
MALRLPGASRKLSGVHSPRVIAGLDPAIHPFTKKMDPLTKKMDPRVKPAGDDRMMWLGWW